MSNDETRHQPVEEEVRPDQVRSDAEAADADAGEGAPQPAEDSPDGSEEASQQGDAADGSEDAGPDGGAAGDGAGADDAPAEPDPLAEALRQRDEYLDHLRRERAEFENFRRRSARERAEALDRGAEHLVGNLIGVLDNFGFVLEAAKDSSDESLAKGAQMVYAELMDVLRKAGLEQVPGEGEPFDPAHHEAMMQVEADEPVEHPVVEQVLRPGYRFKDRVLRPASVSVKQ